MIPPSPAKCSCGVETMSFYDNISCEGLLGWVPCCPRCFRKVAKGLKRAKAGGFVSRQGLIRFHNRDYKPMGQMNWLFWLAER